MGCKAGAMTVRSIQDDLQWALPWAVCGVLVGTWAALVWEFVL